MGVKRPANWLERLRGDLWRLFRGGVRDRLDGERERDLVRGGVPGVGGVVVPLTVSLSRERVGFAGRVVGLIFGLDTPSDGLL